MNRKLFALLLALCLLLSGCLAGEEQRETQPAQTGYSGSLKNYTYYYESGVNRQWEEDVLYVAEVFLGNVFANGHPKLTDQEFQTTFSMDGKDIEYRSFYDEALYEAFLQDINDIIPKIKDMEVYEILFALEKAVAKLSDLHSSVSLKTEHFYPLWLMPFYSDERVEYRVYGLPEEYEDLMHARLTAINGVPMEEVSRSLAQYASYENQYAAAEEVSYLASCAEALTAAGVAEDLKSAVFTLETLEGDSREITLSTDFDRYSGFVGNTPESVFDLQNRDNESDYWWEYIEEDRLLYVRFNRIREGSVVYSSFVKQLREHVNAVPETEYVVIDFRSNPGGQFHASVSNYLSSFLNQLENQKSYVLFDTQSYSSAIWLASNLRQMTDSTLFVGTPGGQPANFFGDVHDYVMPNSGYGFRMADGLMVTDETDNGSALMPDVVIWQTLQDYMENVDTVLSKIVSGEVGE